MTPELIAIIILGILTLRQSCAIRSELLAALREASQERTKLRKQIFQLKGSVTERAEQSAGEQQIDDVKQGEQALPCDIVLTRGHGLLSRVIRFFTRSIGERRTKVNHVGIVVKTGAPPGEAIIVEALRKVRRHSLKDSYGAGRTAVAIYRPTNLTEKQSKLIVAAADNYVGHSYGYLKIILHLFDWVFQGPYLFRSLGCMDRYPICSWLVAHSYAKAGKNFGVDPGAASPDDIWDFVTKSRKYTCVRELSPLESCDA